MIPAKNRLRLCNCLILCTLVFIWGNSLLPAEISQALSDWVKSLLSASQAGSGSGSGLLRKIAHFTEFAALGVLLSWRSGMLRKQKHIPFLWGAAAACVDEGIQLLTPGRASQLSDVLLDCCGVATGLLLLNMGYSIIKTFANNLEDKQ